MGRPPALTPSSGKGSAAAARQRRKLPVNREELRLSPRHNFPFAKVILLRRKFYGHTQGSNRPHPGQALRRGSPANPSAGARRRPEASARRPKSSSNAQRKAQQDGGGGIVRWDVPIPWGVAALRLFLRDLIAVNHAVWRAPDKKKLIDVTPFHSDPKLPPAIVVNGYATRAVS